MIQILGIGVTAQDSLLPKRNVFFSKRLRKRGEGPIVFCIARGQRMKLFYGEAWVFAFLFPFFAREFIFPLFLLGEMDDYAFGPRRSLKRVGIFSPSKMGTFARKGVFQCCCKGSFGFIAATYSPAAQLATKIWGKQQHFFPPASCNKPCDPQSQWSEGGGAREEEEDKNAYPSPPPRIACNFAKITNKFNSCYLQVTTNVH